jgi:hypothetical protein
VPCLPSVCESSRVSLVPSGFQTQRENNGAILRELIGTVTLRRREIRFWGESRCGPACLLMGREQRVSGCEEKRSWRALCSSGRAIDCDR